MRRVLVWCCLLSWFAAACQNGEWAAMKPGLMVEADAMDDGVAADPGANPMAGAFYNDGGDADIRARTENFFRADKGRVASLDDVTAEPPATSNAPARTERMLVQRGEIAVEVARPEESARAFLAQIGEWNGYLQNQNGTRFVVRLPAKRFEEAFAAARGLGRVLRESRAADDVTEEFVDLGIRLDTARKSRERLLEVLAKAEKVEDILKVEAELRRLTEEIERMEGRRKFLADQVALATLAVEFTATSAPPPPPKKRPQRSRFDWIQRVGAESMMGGF